MSRRRLFQQAYQCRRQTAGKTVELLREENLKKIEEHIDEIVRLATTCNLSKKDIIEMVNFSLEEQG